jgi:hypothetical protein
MPLYCPRRRAILVRDITAGVRVQRIVRDIVVAVLMGILLN